MNRSPVEKLWMLPSLLTLCHLFVVLDLFKTLSGLVMGVVVGEDGTDGRRLDERRRLVQGGRHEHLGSRHDERASCAAVRSAARRGALRRRGAVRLACPRHAGRGRRGGSRRVDRGIEPLDRVRRRGAQLPVRRDVVSELGKSRLQLADVVAGVSDVEVPIGGECAVEDDDGSRVDSEEDLSGDNRLPDPRLTGGDDVEVSVGPGGEHEPVLARGRDRAGRRDLVTKVAGADRYRDCCRAGRSGGGIALRRGLSSPGERPGALDDQGEEDDNRDDHEDEASPAARCPSR